MATSFDELIKRGYRWVLVAEVEGIPYLFAEFDPDRIDADAKPSLPSGYTSLSESLLIMPGQSIGNRIDREAGVASGDAWDMVLSRDALVEEGLQSTLFVRPSNTTVITSDLTGTTTPITVADTTGFASSGAVYIGRERITYTSTTSTTFAGTVGRGSLGYAYEFGASGEIYYTQVTDIPTVWRGRWVTLHQHLLSPAGHMLDSTWLTGDYHRVMWRGYVDAHPRPGAYGMQIRCLPLVRILGRELGSGVAGNVRKLPLVSTSTDAWQAQREGWDDYAIYVTPASSVTISLSVHAAGTTTVYTTTVAAVTTSTGMTVGAFRAKIIDAIDAAWNAEAWFDSVSDGGEYPLDISVRLDYPYSYTASPTFVVANCYWLFQGEVQGSYTNADNSGYAPLWEPRARVYAGLLLTQHEWLPVEELTGIGIIDQTIPTDGLGLITQEDRGEVIRWDTTNTDVAGVVLIRVAQRGISGYVQIGKGGKFEVAVGGVGQIGEVLRQILTSSGTTLRGSDDVLPTGYAVPGAWAPSTAIGNLLPGALNEVPAVVGGKASAADVVGGWLALAGRCIVQRRDSSGEFVLASVNTFTASDVYGTAVTAADIEIAGVSLPALADGPTSISVAATTPIAPNAETVITVGSSERILAEGTRTWELSAPGISPLAAAMLAGDLVTRMDGGVIVTMPVAPWLDLQPGDVVVVTAAHPLLYDWAAGSWGATSLYGRVMGTRTDLRTGATDAEFLLEGQQHPAPLSLCPTATIAAKNSTTDFDLGTGEGDRFVAGDLIQFYTPGDEASEKQTRTIDTVTDDNITITVAASSWVGVGTRVTFPTNASATAAQNTAFMYVLGSKVWRS